MGLNGAGGTARAQAAFEAGPGFTFARDQGIDAINRRRNAAGALMSGNADTDAAKFVTGLAYQNYLDWRNALSPYNSLATSTAQAAADQGKTLAGLGTTEANMVTDAARARAALETGRGNSLADIANRYYGGLAGYDVGQGSALAGNATDANRLLTNADLGIVPKIGQTFTDEANAALMANKNLWGLGVKLAELGASAAGGAGGGTAFLPSKAFMNNEWGF